MATQMGLGVLSVDEAMSYDGCPNSPGETITANAKTTVIENVTQCQLPQNSHNVTSNTSSGSSETHTSSSHLMDLPFARQLIRNLSVPSRLQPVGSSTTYPSKCAQRQWSPNEATLLHSRCHGLNELCYGTYDSLSDGITTCSDVSSRDCRSCKCAVGDSSLNREIGAQSSFVEGPSKGWDSAAGSKMGGLRDADLFLSYILVFWLLPVVVSTFLVAALGIPHGACAGALLNSTGNFVVSKSHPRLRTPEASRLLPLLPSACQIPSSIQPLGPNLSQNMSEPYQSCTPSGDYFALGYEQGSHFDNASYGMTGYEESSELSIEYHLHAPQIPPDFFETYMDDMFVSPHISSPLNTPTSTSPTSTSPGTIYEDPVILSSGSGFGGDPAEQFFFFESSSSSLFSSPSLSSPVDTPTSSTFSGDQIPSTPSTLEPGSPPPSPAPPAPEPVQNPDGTWACPQSGCTHPGHKRRCDARKHHKSHTKPYRCKERGCPYRSSNAKDRERHYDTRHATGTHPACPAEGCGVLKSRVDNMRDHIRRKHPGMDYRSPAISALYPRRSRT
ncbi:hypothetical protein L873DRAFT_1674790 [Choiromyces venosus 120613-1]|uniref:C2H2-type domain-containing protein n=1 Tax=Choiromyces venosus 120613-1 TaxID=1336337 RepID=A0A3N4JYG8_9PEZI|nr:hypothetical protein L873DRAFT_1674790 [Choiromyces venosus 120613-1]